MSALQAVTAIIVFGGLSWTPPVIAVTPADYAAETISSHSIASNISQGLAPLSATATAHAPNQDPKRSTVTVSVPQADVTWHDQGFPKASISHAQSCWSAYTSWYASYPGHYASANISLSFETHSTLRTSVQLTSSTIWPTDPQSTYKLCDGTPRASYAPSTVHFNTTMSREEIVVVTKYPTHVPEQPCVLNSADCAVMYYGSNANNLSETNSDNAWGSQRLLGACGLPLDIDVPCLVQGGPVELLYFPVTTEGGDPGGCTEGTTIMPAEKPAPITTLGSTFHPGTVYVSFETLYAAYRSLGVPGGAAVQIGKGYSNEIFEFRSDEISTNCYASMFSFSGSHNPGYGHGTQLNFADLNYPPPASAYACQNQCQSLSFEVSPDGINVTTHTIHPNPCETIFDNFNPLLAIPTRLRSMNTEWASCEFWNTRQANLVFDPPIALTHVASVAMPTLPGGHETTSAARPASTGRRLAIQTATAVADNVASTAPKASSNVPGAHRNPSGNPGTPDAPDADSSQSAPAVADDVPSTAPEASSNVPGAHRNPSGNPGTPDTLVSDSSQSDLAVADDVPSTAPEASSNVPGAHRNPSGNPGTPDAPDADSSQSAPAVADDVPSTAPEASSNVPGAHRNPSGNPGTPDTLVSDSSQSDLAVADDVPSTAPEAASNIPGAHQNPSANPGTTDKLVTDFAPSATHKTNGVASSMLDAASSTSDCSLLLAGYSPLVSVGIVVLTVCMPLLLP